MTNFEKYKDDILGLPEDSCATVMNGKIVDCNEILCSQCDLPIDGETSNCSYRFMKWLYQEAKPNTEDENCGKETESGKANNNSQSCEDCKYDDRGEDEQPCVECCERYLLKFEPKPKEPEMKPCPCCGGKAGMEEMAWDWVVECEKCHLSTRVYPTPEKAAKAWNRRV